MTDINGAPVPPSKPNLTPLWIALAAVCGIVVGVIGTVSVQTAVAGFSALAADTRLADAVEICGASDGIELADGDTTLVIDVQGEDDSSGASYSDQACILSELNVPARVDSHIGQTTSLDGRQEASWDGISIEWSYHPSRGSDMVIVLDPQ